MKALFYQAVRFFGISGIGWMLDFAVYALLGLMSNNLTLNNIISSWVGVSVVFTFATRKVFKSNSAISLKCKYLIYLLYQIILIFMISKLLLKVNNIILDIFIIQGIRNYASLISKILVTPITMILNFFVMKNIIEKI